MFEVWQRAPDGGRAGDAVAPAEQQSPAEDGSEERRRQQQQQQQAPAAQPRARGRGRGVGGGGAARALMRLPRLPVKVALPSVLWRMVLDPKIAHNDYGSFQSPGVGASAHHRGVEIASAALPPGDAGLHGHEGDGEGEGDAEGARLAGDMTQNVPLLPPSAKNDTWAGGTKSGGLHSPTREYYDDTSGDGLAIHRNGGLVSSASNGMVQIDMPAPLREEPRFPKEKWKTFVVTSLAMVHERVPDREKYGPLPDIFLDNVPAIDWALSVSEVLIVISVYAVLIVLVFHKHRFIVMRRVFVILALLYLMRSITMFVTVLPVASVTYYCSPKLNSTSTAVVVQRMWQLFQGFGLSINGKHTYCGDYIYSGHTVMLTMSYLIIAEYSPKRCFPVHWVSWIVSVSGVILVLVAHGHYTVDVIIAYYATTTLFWIYHTLANNPTLKSLASPQGLYHCSGCGNHNMDPTISWPGVGGSRYFSILSKMLEVQSHGNMSGHYHGHGGVMGSIQTETVSEWCATTFVAYVI
ncbi:Uncharacterized protein GBIM_03667 [Gryllus bimaculatus]|nr:Uncharacterized protein GBIM_03667 [Gryllus bimaculatus]